MVKLDGPNVVEVTMQSKETATILRTEVCETSESAATQLAILTPDFDLVIVASGDQESSAGMNGDTPDRAFVEESQRGGTRSRERASVPSCSSNLSTRTPMR